MGHCAIPGAAEALGILLIGVIRTNGLRVKVADRPFPHDQRAEIIHRSGHNLVTIFQNPPSPNSCSPLSRHSRQGNDYTESRFQSAMWYDPLCGRVADRGRPEDHSPSERRKSLATALSCDKTRIPPLAESFRTLKHAASRRTPTGRTAHDPAH